MQSGLRSLPPSLALSQWADARDVSYRLHSESVFTRAPSRQVLSPPLLPGGMISLSLSLPPSLTLSRMKYALLLSLSLSLFLSVSPPCELRVDDHPEAILSARLPDESKLLLSLSLSVCVGPIHYSSPRCNIESTKDERANEGEREGGRRIWRRSRRRRPRHYVIIMAGPHKERARDQGAIFPHMAMGFRGGGSSRKGHLT